MSIFLINSVTCMQISEFRSFNFHCCVYFLHCKYYCEWVLLFYPFFAISFSVQFQYNFYKNFSGSMIEASVYFIARNNILCYNNATVQISGYENYFSTKHKKYGRGVCLKSCNFRLVRRIGYIQLAMVSSIDSRRTWILKRMNEHTLSVCLKKIEFYITLYEY